MHMIVVCYGAQALLIETERTRREHKKTTTRTKQDASVEVTVELREGHPNLDAYSHDLYPDRVAEELQHNYTGGNVEIYPNSISCDMSGTPDEWIEAAETWVSERGDTIPEALERFDSWNDTGHGPRHALRSLEHEGEP